MYQKIEALSLAVFAVSVAFIAYQEYHQTRTLKGFHSDMAQIAVHAVNRAFPAPPEQKNANISDVAKALANNKKP